jgi:hypothetical protein
MLERFRLPAEIKRINNGNASDGKHHRVNGDLASSPVGDNAGLASLIELSTQIILHKFNSPSWLKRIQKANAALEGLTPTKLAAVASGEAYVWSSKATDDIFTYDAVKIRCRPRVTQHGGRYAMTRSRK